MRDAPGAAVVEHRRLPAPPAEAAAPRGRRPLLALASDERLARRAQRGDPHAFDLIFRRYENELYRFCVGILREPQDAQDALQNTMVKAIRALPGEEREINLRPWLYRIAHNEAVELRRRQRPTEGLETMLVDSNPGPAERAERDQHLERLFEDIEDLPARQRAALVMRELNGLEFGEIGDALGTSVGAVRQALYEARRGLHEMKAGREMACAAVTRTLSDGDRRRIGRRQLRAHLRECSQCRRFKREIQDRRQTFAAISPLPIVVACGLVKGAVAGSSGGGVAGIGSLAAGAAVKSTSLPGLAKCVAGVLAIAAIGTAADRGGLVHLRLDPSHRNPVERATAKPAAAEGSGGGAPAAARGVTSLRGAGPLDAVRRDSAAAAHRLGTGAEVSTHSQPPSRRLSGSGPLPAATAAPLDQEPPHPRRGETKQLREGTDPPGQSKAESKTESAAGKPDHPEHPAHPEHPEKGTKSKGSKDAELAGHPEHPAHPAKGGETPPAEPAPAAESSEPAPAAEAPPEKGKASAPGQIKKQLEEIVSEP